MNVVFLDNMEAQLTYGKMSPTYSRRYYLLSRIGKKRPIAGWHNELLERKSLEEHFALLESDPEHRYEYLDGYIYMMTGGSPDHSTIGNNIGRILGNLLQGRRCIVYNSDLYVELTENYRVCPDVTVSCDPRDRGAKEAIHYPCLVGEVLSPTTEARDRGKKSLHYRASETIQEYLLIDAESPIIELFRRERNGFRSLYTPGADDSIELKSHSNRSIRPLPPLRKCRP